MSTQWVWGKSDIPPRCKLSKWEKQKRVDQADELLRTFYRPTFLRPPPPNPQCNYIVEFSARWNGSYLLFTATYACPAPNALATSFDHHFARIGHFPYRDRYNLWARLSNDKWQVVADDLTLADAFAQMHELPWFHF